MAEGRREARAAALQRLKDGDPEGAIALVDDALTAASSDAGLLMLRGIARSQLGAYEAGVEDLRAAAALSPQDSTIRFNLGNALVKLGERDEASQAYQAAVLADPGYEPPRLALDKLDPVALKRIEEHLQVDPELAPAPAPAPLVDVVLGLDGEPLPGVPVPARPAPETPLGGPPPGFGRAVSRPASMPGSLSFVKTWFWIMWGLGLLSSIGVGVAMSFATAAATQAIGGTATPGGPMFGNLPPEALEGMTPEQRQQLEQLQRMNVTPEQVATQAKLGVGFLVIVFVVAMAVSTVLTWLLSKGLGEGASWGYWLAMVLAVLGLLSFPFTIGYIFAIVNLNKPESKAWCGV